MPPSPWLIAGVSTVGGALLGAAGMSMWGTEPVRRPRVEPSAPEPRFLSPQTLQEADWPQVELLRRQVERLEQELQALAARTSSRRPATEDFDPARPKSGAPQPGDGETPPQFDPQVLQTEELQLAWEGARQALGLGDRAPGSIATRVEQLDVHLKLDPIQRETVRAALVRSAVRYEDIQRLWAEGTDSATLTEMRRSNVEALCDDIRKALHEHQLQGLKFL